MFFFVVMVGGYFPVGSSWKWILGSLAPLQCRKRYFVRTCDNTFLGKCCYEQEYQNSSPGCQDNSRNVEN